MTAHNLTLPTGWSIVPSYRGGSTVREWSARYRGEHVVLFDRKRDAVDYIIRSDYARSVAAKIDARRDA